MNKFVYNCKERYRSLTCNYNASVKNVFANDKIAKRSQEPIP